MKLTTTKKAWLPNDQTRVTPSYAPLLPTLYLPGSVFSPALPMLNISRIPAPARGMVVDGIAFKSDPVVGANHSYSSWPLQMGLEGVCDTAANPASNLTANHLLFLSSDAQTLGFVGGGVNMAGTNVTFMNSWIDDARNFTGEVYGVMSRNGGSNQVIRNNHFGAGLSEGVMIGAGSPNCQIGLAIPSALYY